MFLDILEITRCNFQRNRQVMTPGGVHCCILCFRITMGSFPLRNLLEKAKDDEERLTLEIIFMMSNVTPVGQGKNKRRRGTPIDRTEAAFNVFDSDKVFSHTNFNSPTRLLLKVGCET